VVQPAPEETRAKEVRDAHGGADAGLAKRPKVKAKGVEAPPFPGFVMSYDRWRRTKDPHPNVRKFQRRLNERGWKIKRDGNFTKQVEAVIQAFQREKLLAVTGKVDKETWKAIWKAPVT